MKTISTIITLLSLAVISFFGAKFATEILCQVIDKKIEGGKNV